MPYFTDFKDRIPAVGQANRKKITDEITNEIRYEKIEYADNPQQTGTPLNAANMNGLLQVKSVQLSIPTSAWVADSTYPTTDLKYRATISDSEIKSTDVVNVFLDIPSIQIAQEAALSSGAESLTGKFYLYSANIPSATLTGRYEVERGVK